MKPRIKIIGRDSLTAWWECTDGKLLGIGRNPAIAWGQFNTNSLLDRLIKTENFLHQANYLKLFTVPVAFA